MISEKDRARLKRKWQIYLAGFIVAALLLGVTAYAAHKFPTYMGWEVTLFDQINDWPNRLRTFFLIATILPESLWIGLGTVVLTFLFRMYRLAWRLSIVIIGGFGAAFLGKHFIGRDRPVEILQDVHVRVHETGMGFPSGHTMIITVIMLTLIPYVAPKWRWALFVPIILMGLSRIYLGVHTPLDIIGGFAIGLGAVCFLRILPRSLRVPLRLE